MKKYLILLIFTLFIIELPVYGKSWINPSKDWITVDSLDIANNHPFNFCDMSSYDSLNFASLILDPTCDWARISDDGGLSWHTILMDTIKPFITTNGDTHLIFPKCANCISYPSKNLILVGCDSGLIKKSTDAGVTWKDINFGNLSPTYFIKMVNDRIGISRSDNGLYITEDGGENWKNLNFNFKSYSAKLSMIDCISMPDSNAIFVSVAYDYNSGDFEARSIRYFSSFDRGSTWQLLPDTTQSGGLIYFIDRNTGWSCGGKYKETGKNSWCYLPRIYKTTNGGISWVLQLEEMDNFNSGFIQNACFINSLNGIVVFDNFLLMTSDGGANWKYEKINNSIMFVGAVGYAGVEHPIISSINELYRYTKIIPKPDKEPPHIYWTKKECNGNIEDGLATDFPEDSNLRSNMKSIILDYIQSYNYNLFVSPFSPGDTDKVSWKLRRSNPKNKGKAVVTFSDMNDNDTTITFETYPEGFDYPANILSDEFNLMGSASINEKVLNLTPTINNIAGAAWCKSFMPVKYGFVCYFNFMLANGNNNLGEENSLPGGDGIAFVIQNSGDKALGLSGGGIGFEGIRNSLAVEFDTYNDNWITDSINDKNGNHIAVFSGGTGENKPFHNTKYQLGVSDSIPVLRTDSTVYHVMIDYKAEPNALRIFIDTTGKFIKPALEVQGFKIENLLSLANNQSAYVGFTSATGNAWENHDILSWSFCPFDSIATDIKENNFSDLQNDFCISPNPANVYISLNFPPESQTSQIKIYSVEGIEVYNEPSEGIKPSEGYKIDVSRFISGVYYVKVGDRVYRFIKM